MAATTNLFLFILIRKCPKTNQADMANFVQQRV